MALYIYSVFLQVLGCLGVVAVAVRYMTWWKTGDILTPSGNVVLDHKIVITVALLAAASL